MTTTDQALRDVVAAHDKFYTSLVLTGTAQLPESAWNFINNEWAPWRQRWLDATSDGDPLTPSFVRSASESLSSLRERARAAGAPVPELSPYASTADHLAHLGYPHPPASVPSENFAVPIPVQINRETDRRFRDETGWPEGRSINPHTESPMLRRWLQIRYQVAQEFASK